MEINDNTLDRLADESEKVAKIVGNAIALADGDGNWYEIPLTRCDTHEKLVNWIYHLAPKGWVTTKHISLLIAHCAGETNVEITLES